MTTIISYTISAKLAFLSFYFLPVILAGYYLGRRKAMLGAVLSIVYVLVYVVYSPESFQSVSTRVDLYVHIAAWAGFLILTGAALGSVQDKMLEEAASTHRLNEELSRHQEELRHANLTFAVRPPSRLIFKVSET